MPLAFPLTALIVTFALALPLAAQEPAKSAQEGDRSPLKEAPVQVGGEALGEVITVDDGYQCGPCSIDTPLPEGYPRPTAPGALELNGTPPVRRAEIAGSGGASSQRGFWPLFRHIKSRDIAMTAPVEMDYGKSEGTDA